MLNLLLRSSSTLGSYYAHIPTDSLVPQILSIRIDNTIRDCSATCVGVGLVRCEGEVIVQGDEGPVCGVAQVGDCHGVTVGHQEREEEEEQQEVEGEKEEEHSKNAAHVHGWDDYEKTSASGLSHVV